MKLKDIIKKQTLIIVLTVAIVTISTISVSYAVFFDVKKNSEDQVITAGTLTATITKSAGFSLNEVLSDEEGKGTTPLTYTITNTGSLPANYSLCIFNASDADADPNKIIGLGSYKVSNAYNSSGTPDTTANKLVGKTINQSATGTAEQEGDIIKRIREEITKGLRTGKVPKDPTCYNIDTGLIKAGETISKSVKVWISDELYTADGESYTNIELYFDTEVNETEANKTS